MKLGAAPFALLLLGACASETKVSAVPTTAAPIATPADPATRLLSQERCAHEARCRGFGREKRFTSRAACLDSTLVAVRESIGPAACPYGVDDEQVQRCLATMRARMCADAIDAVENVADCRAFEICNSPP